MSKKNTISDTDLDEAIAKRLNALKGNSKSSKQDKGAAPKKRKFDKKTPPTSGPDGTPASPQPIDMLVHQWQRGFKYHCSAKNAERIADLLSVEVQSFPADARGVNPHELQAVARMRCTVWAVAEFVARGYREIDFRFGSNRDLKVVAALNKFLEKRGHPADSIKANICDEPVVAEDAHRRTTLSAPSARVAFFMDVYNAGGTAADPVPMTPHYLGSLGYERVLWIGHKFNALFGICDAAVWRRHIDAAGKWLIEWFADSVSGSYAPHDPCDLMHGSGATASFVWSTSASWSYTEKSRVYGLYEAVEVLPNKTHIPPYKRDMDMERFGVTQLPINDYDNLASQSYSIRLAYDITTRLLGIDSARTLLQVACHVTGATILKKTIVVNLEHLHRAKNSANSRGASIQTYQSLYATVTSMLADDPVYQRVVAAWPMSYTNYAQDLTALAFAGEAEKQMHFYEGMQRAFAGYFKSSNLARTNLNVPVAKYSWESVTLGRMMLVGLFLALTYRIWTRLSKFTWMALPFRKMAPKVQLNVFSPALKGLREQFATAPARILSNLIEAGHLEWGHHYVKTIGAAFNSTVSTFSNVFTFDPSKPTPNMHAGSRPAAVSALVARVKELPLEAPPTYMFNDLPNYARSIGHDMRSFITEHTATAAANTKQAVAKALKSMPSLAAKAEALKAVTTEQTRKALDVVSNLIDTSAVNPDQWRAWLTGTGPILDGAVYMVAAACDLAVESVIIWYGAPLEEQFKRYAEGNEGWFVNRGSLSFILATIEAELTGKNDANDRFFWHVLMSLLPYDLAVKAHRILNYMVLFTGIGRSHNVVEYLAKCRVCNRILCSHTTLGVPNAALRLGGVTAALSLAYMFAPKSQFLTLSSDDSHYSAEFDENHYTQQSYIYVPEALDQTIRVSRMWRAGVRPTTSLAGMVPSFDPTVKVTNGRSVLTDCHDFELAPLPNPDVEQCSGYWRMYCPNAPMYRPETSFRNLQVMIMHRLCKDIAHHAQEPAWAQSYWIMRICARDRLESDTTPLVSEIMEQLQELEAAGIVDSHHLKVRIEDSKDQTMRFPERYCSDLAITETEYSVWKEHVEPAKIPVYDKAFDETKTNPLTVESMEITLIETRQKSNEVLCKVQTIDKPNGYISRPIHAVNPKLAVRLGYEVYNATQRLKYLWNRRRPIFKFMHAGSRLPVTLTYGPAMTAGQLSNWFNDCIANHGIHIIVAGDDSAVILVRPGPNRRITFIEGDNSQHDHTVREPALLAQWCFMRGLGVKADTIALMRRNASANLLIAKQNHPTIKLKRSPERNTGGVDTTVGNSFTVGAALSWCVYNSVWTLFDMDDAAIASTFTDGMGRHGFDMKCKVHSGDYLQLGETFFSLSFLKGSFFRTMSHRFIWAPLPSRTIKCSKTMSNPRFTQATDEQKRTKSLPSMPEALSMQLSSISMSMQVYPWHSLILNAWKRHAAVHPSAKMRKTSEDSYLMPLADYDPDVVIDDDAYVAHMAWWYDTPTALVESWLEQFSKMNLFDFLEHPLWMKMALVDYN